MSQSVAESRILWAAGIDGEVQLADGDDLRDPTKGFTRESAKAKAAQLRSSGERDIEILIRRVDFDENGRAIRYGSWTEAGKIVTWSEALSEIDSLWIEEER